MFSSVPNHWVANGLTVAGSHRRINPSSLPEARSLPSGENATLATSSVWPSGSPAGCPVTGSQSRIVLSLLPEASSRPSGENARLQMVPEWPASGATACWPLLIPHPDGLVSNCRSEQLAVREDAQAFHTKVVLVANQRITNRLASGDQRRTVGVQNHPSGSKQLAIRRERDARHLTLCGQSVVCRRTVRLHQVRRRMVWSLLAEAELARPARTRRPARCPDGR